MPLQYQKDLRLVEARALLVDRNLTVSEAACAVGYESPTHFSRDCNRNFGLPHGRNVSVSFSTSQDAIPVMAWQPTSISDIGIGGLGSKWSSRQKRQLAA
ncbi:MAG: helix-turn-helix domain-containing protein [Hyphomicrobiales bacterium]|nr:helix-turn-helix domain-containing protein [Hyphomicrobiales bacterium]MCP4997874.1 helix-turn-helix domain-containing protein [Hyphomicrobiales bacterium]